MSLNQDIRYHKYSAEDTNNPHGLYDFVKPSRIFTLIGYPRDEWGENEWYVIDTLDNGLWVKRAGHWEQIYNFATGGTAPTDGENVGDGAIIFKAKEGHTLVFKTLVPGTSEDRMPIEITELEDTVSLSTFLSVNSLQDAPQDGGSGIIKSIITDEDGFTTAVLNKIEAGDNVIVTEDTGKIIISSTGGSTGFKDAYMASAFIPNLSSTPRPFSLDFGEQGITGYPVSVNYNQQFKQGTHFYKLQTDDDYPITYWRYLGPENTFYQGHLDLGVVCTFPGNQYNAVDFYLGEYEGDAGGIPPGMVGIVGSNLALSWTINGSLSPTVLRNQQSASSTFLFKPKNGYSYRIFYFKTQCNFGPGINTEYKIIKMALNLNMV